MKTDDPRSAQDWNARCYDDQHAFVWKHGASLVELLTPQPGETILDLGCGTGHLTAQIAAAGATVIGIDSSPEMVSQARASYPDLQFEIADARHLTYADRFDAVFSNAALHWIKESEQVVRGIARALKPGGRLVAEFGGAGNVKAIQSAIQCGLVKVGCDAAMSPWYFPSVAEYSSLLERAGLEVSLAMLFDRPTPLEGNAGMRHWLEMFGGHFLNSVPPEQRDAFFRHVEDAARPTLFREGSWFADYRRLRLLAKKPMM